MTRAVRHPAVVARIVTAGVSVASAFAIVAVLAREGRATEPAEPAGFVEVRLGPDVSDSDARAAVRAWIEGGPDLRRDVELTVVDAPADTETGPS